MTTCFKGPTNFPSPPRRRPGTDPAAWMTWDMLKWFVTTVFDPFAACVEGSGSLDTTDGVVDVNPTTKLFIGNGLKLTNPSTGEAHIATSPLVEELVAAPITIAAGAFGDFSWSHSSGDILTNLSTPTSPKLLNDGVYAISLFMGLATAPTPSLLFARVLCGNISSIAGNIMAIEGGPTGFGPAPHELSFTKKLLAGQGIDIQVANDDPSTSRVFTATSYTIVKFS